jgi:hypothetical protein
MTDEEIKKKRAELEREIERAINEWKHYDLINPIVAGALIPPHYWARQREYNKRLKDLREELKSLPLTQSQKNQAYWGCAIILALLCVVGGLVWYWWIR